MSTFSLNENFARHESNMDYTAIKNMQAKAFDNSDWELYDDACELEKQWEAVQ